MSKARIWLCADDYGISLSVNAAIRELIARGRINATSVMVAAPSFGQSEAKSLDALRTSARAAIGLHVTLTAPFRPMSVGFAPTNPAGAFLPLNAVVLPFAAEGTEESEQTNQDKLDKLVCEVMVQMNAFITAFGHAPDFIDGHQHVHLFGRVSEAVLKVAKARAPHAWLRQCGRRLPFWQRFSDPKGLLLDFMSRGFRARAAKLGLRTNPAFAGTYNFSGGAEFAELFPTFLGNLPDDSVVMCHPGFVDDELKRLDPVTTQREREYAYFADERFPAVLAAHGVTLA